MEGIGQIDAPAKPTDYTRHFAVALITGAAFALYWLSAYVLQTRNATAHFGADTWFYTLLAEGNPFDRIADNYFLQRVTRFHPTTVAMAALWMKILSPLTLWIAPKLLLKGLFATVGAVGVWAAMSAFAAILPRRYVAIFGVIYAASFGVWYFSSIEESKIVTASLSALYIATYLRLRTRWTRRGVVGLTAILLVACLNEIVSGFLVVIPVVDALLRRGWDLRPDWWIAAHALAAPIALLFLEGVINAWLVPAATDLEGTSHLGMLMFYVLKNDHGVGSLYAFLLNWLLFNIAAPSIDASYAVPLWINYKGYFEPSLARYFLAPASACLILLLGVMLVASVLPRYRSKAGADGLSGILLALAAFTLVRSTFFFIFNPPEALLFSPAVTLAHLLIAGRVFTVSRFPAKRELLAAVAVLLLANNGAFMFGR